MMSDKLLTNKQKGLLATLVYSAIKQLSDSQVMMNNLRNLFYDIYNTPFKHLPDRQEEKFFSSRTFNERLVSQIIDIYYNNLRKLKFAKGSQAQNIFYNGASFNDVNQSWIKERLPYQIVNIVSRSVNIPGYNLQEKEFIVMAVLYMLRVLTADVSANTPTLRYFRNNGVMMRNQIKPYDEFLPLSKKYLNPTLQDLQNLNTPTPAVVTTVQTNDPDVTVIKPEPAQSGGNALFPLAIAYYLFSNL